LARKLRGVMGGEQLPIGRGPRPWREPRRADEWLATIAWLELGALVAWAALLGFLAWAFSGVNWDSLSCFDGNEPACAAPESEPRFGQAEAAASALVLAVGVIAVIVTRRHLRGDASRATALTAAGAPAVRGCVAALLTNVPA
jgi:hypothetical protein